MPPAIGRGRHACTHSLARSSGFFAGTMRWPCRIWRKAAMAAFPSPRTLRPAFAATCSWRGNRGNRSAHNAVGSAADDGTVPREQSCSREICVGAARSDVARGSLAARRIEPSLPNRDGRSTVAHVRRIFGIYDWQRARTQRSNTRGRRLAFRQAKTSDCLPPWGKFARIRFLSEALREAGIDLYRWRHAVEAEIGADVELDIREDDPCQRHVEAHLGCAGNRIIVVVRP